jgi:ribosomal protein S18 acetylase RimI-like enzyme
VEALIRGLRPGEAAPLAELLLQANADNLAAFPPDVAQAYRRELLEVASRSGDVRTLVATVDGRLAGTVAFVADAASDTHPWPPGGSVLRFLAVDPSVRGRGIGERLAVAVVDLARERGSLFLGLHTAPAMHAARALYERLGFVRAAEHDFHPDAHYGGGARPDEAPWGLAYVLPLGG